ncbi:MAG TPA: lysylphosphatidylglycerol synthase domain-containing protein [Verrucomicrobiae bacterium]|jgi:uncharacterized membrane protein YbhN (UPF0104 family)|nr:lysylphosphatidylglycerol synthase domain-containing protein [Verrucomicrobiae bacterium]
MQRSLWRRITAITVLVATIIIFSYYFAKHPEVRHQLSHISLGTLGSLLGLYFLSIGALALATLATLRICKLRIPTSEGLLLTAYSAVVNFFGPLQSGPAFRAVYLKKKHHLNLKTFAVASIGYLFFWGAFSSLFLLSGVLKWWLIPLTALGLALTWLAMKTKWVAPRLKGLDLRGWHYLALATFLQIVFVTIIYFIELRTVAPGTTFAHAIIYTGAANLALYVSLTPGAIGFRESFLVFSRHLHHVSDSTIVAANILDRAVYIILLLILAVFIFGTHARRYLALSQAADDEKSSNTIE